MPSHCNTRRRNTLFHYT